MEAYPVQHPMAIGSPVPLEFDAKGNPLPPEFPVHQPFAPAPPPAAAQPAADLAEETWRPLEGGPVQVSDKQSGKATFILRFEASGKGLCQSWQDDALGLGLPSLRQVIGEAIALQSQPYRRYLALRDQRDTARERLELLSRNRDTEAELVRQVEGQDTDEGREKPPLARGKLESVEAEVQKAAAKLDGLTNQLSPAAEMARQAVTAALEQKPVYMAARERLIEVLNDLIARNKDVFHELAVLCICLDHALYPGSTPAAVNALVPPVA